MKLDLVIYSYYIFVFLSASYDSKLGLGGRNEWIGVQRKKKTNAEHNFLLVVRPGLGKKCCFLAIFLAIYSLPLPFSGNKYARRVKINIVLDF